MQRFFALILLLGMSLAFASGYGSIAGTVTDATSGNPIPNALVTAQGRNNAGGQAYTDERGHYLIENLEPGHYRVRAEHRHYEPGAYGSPVRVMANQPSTGIHIRLRPRQRDPGAITGRVTDRATGEPIPGAVVVARGPNGGARGLTNRNGEYAIRGLQPGRYQVAAMAKRYLRELYPEPVIVQAGQVTPDINFELTRQPARGAIAGQVLEAGTNRPIAGATVVARAENSIFRSVTDRHGFYRIHLPAGEYQVAARKPGYETETYPRPVTVRPREITGGIDFHLRPRNTDSD